MTRTLFCFLAVLALAVPARAGARIKDITDLEGARSNQLYGFGLVVGLNGTGGSSKFTQQVAVDMMKRLCVNSKIVMQVQTDNVFQSRSVSTVMVMAEIGPFARGGSRLDVTVSILDNATSLQGGTLLFTPLKGADGVVYAVAQGPLSVGGFTFGGAAASAQKNFVAVARIPGGAFVEHEARGEVMYKGRIHLMLKNPDYATSRSIAAVINEWAPGRALPLDAGTVEVDVPHEFRPHSVAFLSDMGNLEVITDTPARVIINERTGTVVAGENVKITTVAIAHGNLAIVTRETPQVSQPNAFSSGRSVVVPRTQVGVTEQGAYLHIAPQTVTVADLARALNALGVTPRDLISIFQAIKQAGALQAELVIM
ncbi:MAG TPA: flagellar basal body P-ring protein FlgI [Gemmataceae bacterium]|nr:flagellar basal body P-ring protein FlgI [Gemmataceae bacterium]